MYAGECSSGLTYEFQKVLGTLGYASITEGLFSCVALVCCLAEGRSSSGLTRDCLGQWPRGGVRLKSSASEGLPICWEKSFVPIRPCSVEGCPAWEAGKEAICGNR